MKKVFTFIGLVSIAAFSHAQIVINEIYTGGGLLGAAITNDFVELKNIGTTTASLTGATLQYANGSGEFTQYYPIPSITLTPGQTYLIQQGSDGLGGLINLLNPNLIVNVVLNFDGSAGVGVGVGLGLTTGKVALASNSTRVTGPNSANVLDFVGYGLVDQYEGAGPAPSPTILNSISRTSGDTNDNNVDFTVTLPTPQSSSVTLATQDISSQAEKSHFIKNSFVKNNEIIFGEGVKDVKIYTLSGRLIKDLSSSNIQQVNIAELPKGNYIVTGTVNNKAVSHKIVKD